MCRVLVVDVAGVVVKVAPGPGRVGAGEGRLLSCRAGAGAASG
jgi:hypothetical protein